VLYEWRRGPRRPEELAAQETLWPSEAAIAFGPDEALTASGWYRVVRAPRGRELDLAMAACASRWNAALWTLNVKDFRDVPGLELFEAR